MVVPFFGATTLLFYRQQPIIIITMKTLKSAIIAIVALVSSFCQAQNVTDPVETGPTYIGSTREVGKFAGRMALSQDYASYGITVGTYDDNPDLIVTELVITTFSSNLY